MWHMKAKILDIYGRQAKISVDDALWHTFKHVEAYFY